jgi:hypothetical protein
VLDGAVAAGAGQHLFGQFQYRELAGVAEVDRTGDLTRRVHQRDEAVD